MAAPGKTLTPGTVQPSALGSPVPEATKRSNIFADLIEEVPEPSGQGADADGSMVQQQRLNKAQAAGPQAEENLFAQVAAQDEAIADQAAQEAPVKATDPDFPFEPDVIGAEAQFQQFQDFKPRVINAFAVTNKQTETILEKHFGPKNVRKHDGDFWVRDEGAKKFRKFDPKAVEVVMDTLEAVARPAVEEAALIPGEVAGGALGTAVAGPGMGTGVGVVGGRAATAPFAVALADKVGEMLGVPEDPNRSFAQEAAMASAIEAAVPVVGKLFKKWIPGSAAWREAAQKAEAEHITLSNASQEVAEASARLENAGLVQNIPGTNTPVALFQLQNDSAQVNKLTKIIKDDPAFQKLMVDQGNAIGDTMIASLRAIPGVPGKGVLSDKGLAEAVTDASKTLRKQEGQAIQRFKNNAKMKFGNQKVPVSEETTEIAFQIMDQLQIQRLPDGSLKLPDKEAIENNLGVLGITDPNTYKAFVNTLSQVYHQSKKGVSPEAIERIVTTVGDMNKKAQGPMSAQWAQLTDGFRTQRREIYKAGYSSQAEKDAVDATMDRFSDLRGSIMDLRNSLDGKIGKKAFIRQVINGGANGVPRLSAAQTILAKEHPALWQEVKAEYIEQVIADRTGKEGKRTGLDAQGIMNMFNPKAKGSIGKESLDILFDDAGVTQKNIHDLATLARRVDKTALKSGEDMTKKAFTDVLEIAQGFRPAIARAAYNMITFGGTDRAWVSQLSKEGIEKHVMKSPKHMRGRVHETLNSILGFAHMDGLIDRTPELLKRAPGELVERGIKGGLRGEFQGDR